MDNISKLMERREEIGFEMIEADSETSAELAGELQEIEQELEVGTGMTIDQLEEQWRSK